MKDDFLHRIRVEPPQRFIASLKVRLDQQDRARMTREPVWRRFFVGSVIVGTALATGLFVSRTTYVPRSDDAGPTPAATLSLADDRHAAPAPQATDATTPSIGITAPGKADGVSRTPVPLGVGATVAVYPTIKEAVRFMNRNMNVYPPFPEPTISMMSADTVFASLCAVGNPVDAVIVDRRILPEELDACHRINKHIAEVKLGYEAIVLARSNLYDAPKLNSRAIFLALARDVPNPQHPEELIKNPNVSWDEVDPALPSERIDVTGPPLSTATGIAFRDLILKAGCLGVPTIASLKGTDPVRFEDVCGSVRTDGVYRVSELLQHSGSNPFDYVGYLQANPGAIALLGYRDEKLRYLSLAAGSIDGITPTRSTIYSGSYAGARVLYLYANTAAPHMRELALAIWESVGGASGDLPWIPTDGAEQRNLWQQVMTLSDLKF